jgi:hypothetical protein
MLLKQKNLSSGPVIPGYHSGIEVSFSREETALQSSLGTTESPFALRDIRDGFYRDGKDTKGVGNIG